ncbi:hypothetical protein NE555_17505, partial [Alistipes onderdonkii]|nr:hypothetical protein [Alistipes onderdonkii]
DGGTKYLGAPAAGFIGECVADPLLRNVLAGTNPLYGGVRESSTLYHHAMVNHSNIEGACRFTGDAADRRRTGGEDPRARRDDAGAEPRRSPAHRRA